MALRRAIQAALTVKLAIRGHVFSLLCHSAFYARYFVC